MLNGLVFSWHLNLITLIVLAILCLLYTVSILFAGRGESHPPINIWRVLAFVAAIMLSAFVLLTPFDTIARTQLFAAHMVQAVVLTTLCAPLLLASCHDWLLQPVLEHPVFRHVLRALTRPLIASIIFNLTFLAWHAPAIFDAAQRNEVLYQLEMLSFLFTALLNWWPLIGPSRELRRLSYPQQMLYAFLDGQPVDIYAFLLVFTGTVFYKQYVLPLWFTQAGLSAVADQTIAGSFLLIPGLVDLVVMSPLFFRWLGQLEQQAKVADQKRQEEAEAEEAENARREAEEAEKVGGMEKSEIEA
ncbi:MAG: cytochrome c oxidase assembly protein [Chloroflexi bacterium]|nr:MAG: cytochrome c oxidase assembly protein [Chloroflexota bacterium]